MDYLQSLVRELTKLPGEVEWVEFKLNNKSPERIAEYISGLSNAATLFERPKAYLVWGVKDDTHEIIGTDFEYRDKEDQLAQAFNLDPERYVPVMILAIGKSNYEIHDTTRIDAAEISSFK